MERRNLIVMGVAIAIGLLAVFLANSWFSGVEERQARQAAEQELVQIAVARQNLEFGTPLTADNVRMAAWPAQSVPPGSYTTADQLIAAGNVAIRPIAEGEPILRSRISERAILSANLPNDMRAMTVPVSEVSGVGGFVVPGDVVDVMVTRKIPGDGASSDDQMTSIVLENIQVLAVDRRASESSTEAQVSKSTTLQVDQLGAQKLALAMEIGRLSLALRNVQDNNVNATRTVTPADLGGGGIYMRSRQSSGGGGGGDMQPRPALARAPSATAPLALPARPSGPSMTVYRGTESRNEEVQRYGR